MRPPLAPTPRARRAGFTLAEAAVTIAVVAIVLTLTLQALEGAKVTAAHTMLRKTARELGVELLGEIEAGRWQDELESGMTGTFAEQDYPDYEWELALGDESFPDLPEWDPNDDSRPIDTYRLREQWREDNTDDEDDEEEDEEPFEKVKLRVIYPKLRQFQNQLVLERWVRWSQVYGGEEEEELPAEEGAEGTDPAASPGGADPTGASSGAGQQKEG